LFAPSKARAAPDQLRSLSEPEAVDAVGRGEALVAVAMVFDAKGKPVPAGRTVVVDGIAELSGLVSRSAGGIESPRGGAK
jgi:hypothetical protein